MRQYKFTVVVEQDEDGKYIAYVPALKGCHTQADNLNDLDNRIREAIELCLEVQKDVEQSRFVGIHEVEIAK